MKAIILTATGREHTYVANALAQALGDSLAGVVLESGAARPVRSLRRVLNRYGIIRFGERALTKLVRRAMRHGARQAAAHDAVLGSVEPLRTSAAPVRRVSSVNDPDAHAFLREVQPTHLFVYGTGIVRGATLRLATSGALNLHTGLSPYYRGSDAEFWPLYLGEPHMVGITVHECTTDLDGGAIYARASVELSPDDDAFLAFARCVKTGAHVYSTVAAHVAQGAHISPLPQDLTTGRLYRFANRTFAHELAMEWKVQSGAVRRSISRVTAQDLPFARPEVGW